MALKAKKITACNFTGCASLKSRHLPSRASCVRRCWEPTTTSIHRKQNEHLRGYGNDSLQDLWCLNRFLHSFAGSCWLSIWLCRWISQEESAGWRDGLLPGAFSRIGFNKALSRQTQGQNSNHGNPVVWQWEIRCNIWPVYIKCIRNYELMFFLLWAICNIYCRYVGKMSRWENSEIPCKYLWILKA